MSVAAISDELKFHHVGIACEDILAGIDYAKELFQLQSVSETVYDGIQDANLCMVTLRDGTRLELVSGNAIKSVLRKNQHLYHVCYTTRDIEKSTERLLEIGAYQMSELNEAIFFGGRKVVFFMTKMGMVELLEE